MTSNAKAFNDRLNSIKEFVDNEGRQLFILYFEDDSGLVYSKTPRAYGPETSELTVRERYAKEAMRNIASATEFEFDGDANTQQNLRNLMRDKVKSKQTKEIEGEYDGKYLPFKEHLLTLQEDEILYSFGDIEEILGFDLPNSASNHDAWWSNGGHDHSKAWTEAGYKVDYHSLPKQTVLFKRK